MRTNDQMPNLGHPKPLSSSSVDRPQSVLTRPCRATTRPPAHLLDARERSNGEQLHALDVNGRSYCGCGASFCMTLERKALRDPTKSLKAIVDTFP